MSRWVFIGFSYMISVFTILSLLALGGITANPDEITLPQDFAKPADAGNTTGGPRQSWGFRFVQCQAGQHLFLALTIGATWCTLTTTFGPVFRGEITVPVLSTILDVIRISAGTVNFLWQITVFTIQELPPIANLVLFGPMAASFIYMIIGIFRGFSSGE